MKKVNSKITYPLDFKTKYVNGAFGSFNDKGDFIMNLFFENIAMPTGSTINIYDGGADENFEVEEIIDRHVEASVAMSLETAKSICDWLKNNIDNYESNLVKK